MEPLRVELHKQRDEEDTQDVERMAAEPAEGDEPQFVLPSAAHREDEAQPDKHLFQPGTAPDDVGARPRLKADDMVAHHINRVAEERDQPIDRSGNMARHPFERRRHVPSEPCHHLAVLIARKGEFPAVVSHEKRHHENDDVQIGFHLLSYFLYTVHLSFVLQMVVLAKGTSSIAQKSWSKYLK